MPVLSRVPHLFTAEQCQASLHTLRWKDRPLQRPRCQRAALDAGARTSIDLAANAIGIRPTNQDLPLTRQCVRDQMDLLVHASPYDLVVTGGRCAASTGPRHVPHLSRSTATSCTVTWSCAPRPCDAHQGARQGGLRRPP